MESAKRCSHLFPRQRTRLLHPIRELLFVEFIVLVDIEVSHFLLLRLAGRDGAEGAAAKEGDFDVFREAMKAAEPALAFDAVERRVPFDRFVHVGNGPRDERVAVAAHVALPARHGSDVSLHRSVAVALRNLRIATGEELWRCGFG